MTEASIVVGMATIAVKAGGPVLALVAAQAFASDEALVVDERAAGLRAIA